MPHFGPIEALWDAYVGDLGAAPFDNGQVVADLPVEVVGITDGGLAPTRATSIYREWSPTITAVTTVGGRTLRTTSNHRFMTVDGPHGVRWLPAGLLRAGAPLAVPKALGDGEPTLLSAADAYFLGVALGS